MKYIVALALILTTEHRALRAQDSLARSSDSINYNNIMLHAEVGYTNFHAWKLSDMFIPGGGKEFPAFTTVGLGGLISADYEKFRFEGYYGFHNFLPFDNDAMIDGSSVKTRLRGWEATYSKFGADIVPAKLFDVSGALGFYFGNLKLDWNNRRYTNPFVAPMAKIDLRVNLWRISVGARAAYRYDITYGNWKRKSYGMAVLPEYKFREFQCMVFVGWIILSQ